MTDGVYVPAKVAALDLQSIVDEHIEPIVEEATVKATRAIPEERFPILLLLSLTFLVGAAFFSTVPQKGGS